MITTSEIILRIVMAILLGSLLGIERTLAGKRAGMRTYAMVSMGSALFILISEIVIPTTANPGASSPLALASAVISGIGFIGAGLLLFQNEKFTGLTTAAGLWVSAGVGIACGFGLFTLSLVATIAALFVFTILWFLEKRLKRFSYKTGHFEENQEK